MKFLIVAPRLTSGPGQFYTFPLGLAYISGALKMAGFDVTCLNLNHYWNEPIEVQIKRTIVENDIDVVLLGGISPQYGHIKFLMQCAIAARANIITIVGGGMVSAQPEIVFNALNPSYGVVGEGDITIVELVGAITENRPVGDIPGIIYRDEKGQATLSEKRKPIKDLDSIPRADYEGLEFEKYLSYMVPTDAHESYLNMLDKPRLLPVIASRSCPYECSFCFHPLGRVYRQRSLDSFFDELDYMVERYSINAICVFDELFAHDKVRLNEFCERIKKYDIRWIVQLRVDIVNEEILQTMRDSGCVFISYGIESMSDTVLKSMRKKITREQVDKALQMTYDSGIGIQGNLIFGDTGETRETVEESLQWWRKNKKYYVNVSMVVGFPGTKLYDDAVAQGKIQDPVKYLETGCPPVNTSQLTDKEYDEIVRLSRVLNNCIVPESLCNVTKIVPQKEIHVERNTLLLTIEATCPHCGKQNTYINFPVGPNPMARFNLRIACKACNRRIDVAFSLTPQTEDTAETTACLAQAKKCCEMGMSQEALQTCAKVLADFPWHEKASQLMGDIYLCLMVIDKAVSWLSRAALTNPFNLETHARLAAAVTLAGNYYSAGLHLEYVETLERMKRDPVMRERLKLVRLTLPSSVQDTTCVS